jgi:hypothetical protein
MSARWAEFAAWPRRLVENVVVLAEEAARRSARTVNRMLTAVVAFSEFDGRRGNHVAQPLVVETPAGTAAFGRSCTGSRPAAGAGGRAVRLPERRALPRRCRSSNWQPALPGAGDRRGPWHVAAPARRRRSSPHPRARRGRGRGRSATRPPPKPPRRSAGGAVQGPRAPIRTQSASAAPPARCPDDRRWRRSRGVTRPG